MLTNQLLLVLASLGLAQGILLSFYLLTLKRGDRKATIFLGLALLGLTIRIGKSVVDYYIPLAAWQRNIGISGIFITGPFLWFYGRALLNKNERFNTLNYLHLIPFILFISFVTIIPSNGSFESYWNYGLVVLHLAIYLFLSFRLLFLKRIETQRRVYIWYRNILIGSICIWGFYLANFLNITPYYISGPIFYTFLIYSFSYLFLKRTNLNLEKYESSKLDKKSSKELLENVKRLFINGHMFLDSNITVNTVAVKLSVSSRDVSQAINENLNQNFYEFVNSYRIENAKQLLKNKKYENEKMQTIAFDSGFSNITSFNLAFKKITKLTPTEFRKQSC